MTSCKRQCNRQNRTLSCGIIIHPRNSPYLYLAATLRLPSVRIRSQGFIQVLTLDMNLNCGRPSGAGKKVLRTLDISTKRMGCISMHMLGGVYQRNQYVRIWRVLMRDGYK